MGSSLIARVSPRYGHFTRVFVSRYLKCSLGHFNVPQLVLSEDRACGQLEKNASLSAHGALASSAQDQGFGGFHDCLALAHRAKTAFRAASWRCSGVIFAARAGPPFFPPLRPKATA